MGDETVEPLRTPAVLRVERSGTAVVVRLGGELDLYNADELRTALARAVDDAPDRVVVDMAEVEFIDSTALGVLIETRSKAGSKAVALAAPQAEARRALQVSGLDRHLPVHDSVDDAIAG